jgi:hypothetical protein
MNRGVALGMLLAVASACATADFIDAPKPDAGRHGPCPSQPSVDCDAGAPEESNCHAEPGAGDAGDPRRTIPPGSYRLGCKVSFPDPVPLKATGECVLHAQCECVGSADVAGSSWKCVP